MVLLLTLINLLCSKPARVFIGIVKSLWSFFHLPWIERNKGERKIIRAAMIFLQTLWFTYQRMIFFSYALADSTMCTLSCWIQLWKCHPTSSAMCIWVLFPSGQCFLYRMWSWSSLYWPRPGTKTLSLWNLQSQSKKNTIKRHYRASRVQKWNTNIWFQMSWLESNHQHRKIMMFWA